MKSLISLSEILQAIEQVAKEIGSRYESITLVSIMKGALPFTSDLLRALPNQTRLEILQCSSYGLRGKERGEVQIFGLERFSVENQHALLIDEIWDTGHTLSAVHKGLVNQKPKSLETLVLLEKIGTHQTPFRPDRVLFQVPDTFLVGYGLDYKELYRGLPGIYQFEDA